MATWTIRQVLPRSVDTAGVSVTTATCRVEDPRQGQLYNQATLAAAVPIWFHHLQDGRQVALFSRRLTAATVAPLQQSTGPLLYRTATESTAPSWAIFDPATGAVSRIGDIPSNTIGDRVLTAAVSRGNYLFTLSKIGDTALIQHFRIGTHHGLVLQAEEVVPGSLGLGLFADYNDLWVFGAKSGVLTLARKNWGRIGDNTAIDPRMRWRYHTDKGWSGDLTELTAMPGAIPAQGPVSIANFRNRFYLTVPVQAAAAWSVKTYTSRAIDAKWSSHPFTVSLGTDATYTGGTAQLQPQLSLSSGYTNTITTYDETVLDNGSDYIQVFTGLCGQTVVMPSSVAPVTGSSPATYLPYTVYNKTLAQIRVQTSTGEKIATLRAGGNLVLTPTSATPTAVASWTTGTSAVKTPQHRTGFPYVVTTRRSVSTTTNGTTVVDRTLNTSWGAFAVSGNSTIIAGGS